MDEIEERELPGKYGMAGARQLQAGVDATKGAVNKVNEKTSKMVENANEMVTKKVNATKDAAKNRFGAMLALGKKKGKTVPPETPMETPVGVEEEENEEKETENENVNGNEDLEAGDLNLELQTG